MKLFFLYFLLIPLSLSAQDRFFEDAWIRLLDGTIRKGQINRVRESALSKEIAFRADVDANVQNFTPISLAGFGFVKDSLRFETVEYEYKVESARFKYLRFAKVMLKGRTSLFKLQIPEEESKVIFERGKELVYILRKDGKDYTLRQKENLDGNQYFLKKEYQNALRYLADDCPEMRNLTNKVEFTDKEITAFVLDYNHCKDPDNASKMFSHKSSKKRWQGFEAGGMRLFVPDFSGGYGTFTGFFRETLKPDLHERLSLITSVDYQYLSEKVFETTRQHHAVRAHLLANARLTEGHIVPFANIGFGGEVSNIGGFRVFVTTGAGLWIGRCRIMAAMNHTELRPGGIKIVGLSFGYNFRRKE
jgi:hypothetical protein